MRHIFSRSRNRFLSIKEILEEPFNVQLIPGICSHEYFMVENTPEEIRDVIEEFLTKPEPYEYANLQETFNEGRRKQIRRWLEQGEPRGWRGVPERRIVIEQYKIAAVSDGAAGTLGRRCRERNWLMDELEKSTTVSQVCGIV